MKLNLSSSIKNNNGSFNDPDWNHVEKLLNLLKKHDGSVELCIILEDDYAGNSVDVIADSQKYLITYLCNTEDDEIIYAYDNKDERGNEELVEILGNNWDSSTICYNIDVIFSAFKEFFETGKISLDDFYET